MSGASSRARQDYDFLIKLLLIGDSGKLLRATLWTSCVAPPRGLPSTDHFLQQCGLHAYCCYLCCNLTMQYMQLTLRLPLCCLPRNVLLYQAWARAVCCYGSAKRALHLLS